MYIFPGERILASVIWKKSPGCMSEAPSVIGVRTSGLYDIMTSDDMTGSDPEYIRISVVKICPSCVVVVIGSNENEAMFAMMLLYLVQTSSCKRN